MNNLIILPLLLHLFTAILLLALWRRARVHRYISVVSNFVILLVAVYFSIESWNRGIITFQAGNWPAPFGITFVLDSFSSMMVLLTSISAFAISVYSGVAVNKARMRYGYFSIFLFLLMGLNGVYLTGDICSIFVLVEVLLVALFVMMTQ